MLMPIRNCHSERSEESAFCCRASVKPKTPWRLVFVAFVLAAFAFVPTLPLYAQSSSSKDTPKPKPNATTDNATQNAPDQPTWDPLRAERDLEVGQYYMHKGDLDAAIDRFEDAAVAKPGYAIPYRFLGECQERKGLKRDAIKSYTRYLDLFPHAEDKEKIEKKIEKLRSEVEKSKKKSAG
jgi:tetratricopeptide (TPR) repeat protein